MYLQIYIFSILVFTLGTLMFVLSLNLNLHMVPTGNKGSKILRVISAGDHAKIIKV